LETFEISRLAGAQICLDGSVLLVDGTPIRAVEVTPALLPYELSELDNKILRYLIALQNADYCYRSIHEGLPEDLQEMVPDIRALDYDRVRMIRAPLLKVIRGYICEKDPSLRVSNQKIADALAKCGVRIPRHRRRRG
jgi:hypothetical protein